MAEIKIPIEIYDPFYNDKNQARLAKSIADAEAGKLTIHELINNEDECTECC